MTIRSLIKWSRLLLRQKMAFFGTILQLLALRLIQQMFVSLNKKKKKKDFTAPRLMFINLCRRNLK